MKKIFASILALFSLATFAQFNPLAPWMKTQKKLPKQKKHLKNYQIHLIVIGQRKTFLKKGVVTNHLKDGKIIGATVQMIKDF